MLRGTSSTHSLRAVLLKSKTSHLSYPSSAPQSHIIPISSPTILSRRNINVFAEFMKSVRRQVDENKEFQKNVKLLSDETSRLAESDAVNAAKTAVSKTSETTSKVVNAVGSVVDATLEAPVVKKTGEVLVKTAETVSKAAEPILDTKAAKAIGSGVKEIKQEIIGSSSNAFYAEYKPKEIREKERQEYLDHIRRKNPLLATRVTRPAIADPNAGTSLELHKSSKMAQAWENFKEKSPLAQRLFSIGVDEESMLGRVKERFSRFFEETEEAKVVRSIRAVDPSFRVDLFLKEVTQYVVPEIMEAYLSSDSKTLKEWCSEQAYARLSAGFEAQKKQGLTSDCKILDIRNVDIRKMNMLENEVPVILITFQSQEVLLFRNKKGEIVVGKEDQILNATYVMAFTKKQILEPAGETGEPGEFNMKTNNWVIIDWARQGM